MEGFISVNRKILEWEWYTDNNVKSLFIHCLIKANFKAKSWRGQFIERGQFITSYNTLSLELNLSVKQIRLAFDKLKSTDEIMTKGTNKNTVVTVVKYEVYQTQGQTKDKQKTNKGQSKDTQRATTNNDNKENKENNDNKKVYSEEVNQCFDNCLNYFEKHLHPKNKDKWLDTIDKLNRLDKIPFELIEKITRQTREDDFWRTNFMSLTKLRQTQKSSGLKYIVVFNEKLKNNGTSGKKNEQLTYEQWKAESSGKSIADEYKEWKSQ